ncbi:hypothetical protein VPH35_073104 [Triticum aestivum]
MKLRSIAGMHIDILNTIIITSFLIPLEPIKTPNRLTTYMQQHDHNDVSLLENSFSDITTLFINLIHFSGISYFYSGVNFIGQRLTCIARASLLVAGECELT